MSTLNQQELDMETTPALKHSTYRDLYVSITRKIWEIINENPGIEFPALFIKATDIKITRTTLHSSLSTMASYGAIVKKDDKYTMVGPKYLPKFSFYEWVKSMKNGLVMVSVPKDPNELNKEVKEMAQATQTPEVKQFMDKNNFNLPKQEEKATQCGCCNKQPPTEHVPNKNVLEFTDAEFEKLKQCQQVLTQKLGFTPSFQQVIQHVLSNVVVSHAPPQGGLPQGRVPFFLGRPY